MTMAKPGGARMRGYDGGKTWWGQDARLWRWQNLVGDDELMVDNVCPLVQ